MHKRSWRVEAGGSRVQGCPEPCREFEVNLHETLPQKQSIAKQNKNKNKFVITIIQPVW